MKLCRNCNMKNPDGAVFCVECGLELEETISNDSDYKKRKNLSQISDEIQIIPTKYILCPHCSFEHEIEFAKEYQCPNCDRIFRDQRSFFYKCDKCATPIVISIYKQLNPLKCSVCHQKYNVIVKESNLTDAFLQQGKKREPIKFSFGFLLLLGIITLVISLVSYSGFESVAMGTLSSQLLDNIVIFIIASFVLWFLISVLIRFFQLDESLILTEGMSILTIDLLLVLFMAFIHENPTEFSSFLPFALFIVYAGWIALRFTIYLCNAPGGGAPVHNWYLWFCMCDSADGCLSICFSGNCDCENCECGNC